MDPRNDDDRRPDRHAMRRRRRDASDSDYGYDRNYEPKSPPGPTSSYSRFAARQPAHPLEQGYVPDPALAVPYAADWPESGEPGTLRLDAGEPRGGGYAGAGPRDYTREDARILEDVCDRLTDDDEVDARTFSVEVEAGDVILEGTVTDRFTKYRAEDVAASVRGVRDVRNLLRLQPPSEDAGATPEEMGELR